MRPDPCFSSKVCLIIRQFSGALSLFDARSGAGKSLSLPQIDRRNDGRVVCAGSRQRRTGPELSFRSCPEFVGGAAFAVTRVGPGQNRFQGRAREALTSRSGRPALRHPAQEVFERFDAGAIAIERTSPNLATGGTAGRIHPRPMVQCPFPGGADETCSSPFGL
jgi:hypothetical protein